MRNRLLFSAFVFALSFAAKGQQTATLDHYRVQPYFTNPSAAGLKGTSVFLDYRKQWVGFSGAPVTQVFAVDGAVSKDKIGLGLMLVNDQVNILGSTEVMSTFAYRIKFEEHHFLRFGVSAGVNQNRILFDKIVSDDASEMQVFQNNQNASSFDAAAGLYYELGELKVGISSAHLFGERYYYENNFNAKSLRYQNIRHYLANAQYRFDINEGKWGVMPSVQVRAAQGLKPLVEGGVTGYYKKSIWLSFDYANQVGYTIGLGGILAKNIVLGYAYTLSANAIAGYNQGTHDIVLGYRFTSKNNGNYADQKAVEELQRQYGELFEKADYIALQNGQLKKEVEEQKRALRESIYGLDSLKKKMMENQPELNKIIQENQEKLDKLPDTKKSNVRGDNSGNTGDNGINSSNSTSKGDNSKKEKTSKNKDKANASNDTKSLFANAKNEPAATKEDIAASSEEISPGKIYVVIGATKTLAVAKQYQTIINREYSETTKIVRSDSETWYFIYTKSFDNKEDAAIEKERMINLDTKALFVGNPWRFITIKN